MAGLGSIGLNYHFKSEHKCFIYTNCISTPCLYSIKVPNIC